MNLTNSQKSFKATRKLSRPISANILKAKVSKVSKKKPRDRRTSRTSGSSNSLHSQRGKVCSNACLHRVEITAALFFLAYTGTTPLVEQLVHEIVETEYTAYETYIKKIHPEYLSRLDGALATKTYGGVLVHPSCRVASNNTNNSFPQINWMFDNAIQSTSSVWLMYIKLAITIPAVFTTLIIGTSGDQVGRKRGLLISTGGCALRVFSHALSIYFDLPPLFLMLGGLFEGFTGSHLNMYSCLLAYIADSAKVEDRSYHFMVLQTVSTISSSVAELAIGFLIKYTGYVLPMCVIGGTHTLNYLHLYFCIPNSYPQLESGTGELSNLHGSESPYTISVEQGPPRGKIRYLASLVKSMKSFHHNSFRKHKLKRFKLIILQTALIFTVGINLGKSAVETLFLLAPPICWDSIWIGYFNSLSSVGHGILGFFAVWLLAKCVSDPAIAMMGGVSNVVSRIQFAFATNTNALFIVPFTSFGTNVVTPVIRSLMSRLVNGDQQGTLFAAVFSLETLCEVFSGALLNAIYADTVAKFRGFVFLVMAASYSVTIILLIVYYIEDKVNSNPASAVTRNEVNENSMIGGRTDGISVQDVALLEDSAGEQSEENMRTYHGLLSHSPPHQHKHTGGAFGKRSSIAEFVEIF